MAPPVPIVIRNRSRFAKLLARLFGRFCCRKEFFLRSARPASSNKSIFSEPAALRFEDCKMSCVKTQVQLNDLTGAMFIIEQVTSDIHR